MIFVELYNLFNITMSSVITTNSYKIDRIYGMFMGCVLGDVLGAPHEYRFSKVKYTGSVEHPIERSSRFQGLRKGVIGELTDDSEMTIAILKSLARNKNRYVKDDVIKSYLDFANNCSLIGKNTRTLFTGIKTVKSYYNRFDKTFPDDTAKFSQQSNGCLMRASALALASNIDDALQDYAITNPNNVCKDIVTFFVKLLRNLIQLQGNVKSYIQENTEVQAYIRSTLADKKDVKQQKGWIRNAIYCALYALQNFDNFTDGMSWVIQQGGDTDTNGAIAGALLGCVYGKEQLEKEQKANLEVIQNCDQSSSDFKHSCTYKEGLTYISQICSML